MWHACGRREINIGFWWGNLKEGDYLEGPGIDRGIKKWSGRAYTGYIP
jgi:hypothetical protein